MKQLATALTGLVFGLVIGINHAQFATLLGVGICITALALIGLAVIKAGK